MARQLQLRRGTNAENNTFTGAVAEVTVDTDKKALRIHDGSTPGGFTVNSYTADNQTISPTSSNLLQAIGQVNKRNNTPVYTWTGTKSEYAALGTYHNDWVYVVTSDSVVEDHRVIAFQEPTEENDYTWYRKYADGWVEQGGAIKGLTNWADKTITLPVAMKNRGYSYVQSPIMNTSTGPGSWEVGVTLKTETQITSRFYSSNGYLPTWEVKGMYAE